MPSASDYVLNRLRRLGASVDQMAEEAYQDLFGFQSEGGYKPPRADIAKMMAITEKIQDHVKKNKSGVKNVPPPDLELSLEEVEVLSQYDELRIALRSSDEAFAATVDKMVQQGLDGNKVRAMLSSAISKFELQQTPVLLGTIQKVIGDALEISPQSYKLWPWAINEIKKEWKNWLWPLPGGTISRSSSPLPNHVLLGKELPVFLGVVLWSNHLVDLMVEAAPILRKLRIEHRLPKGFDINKMSWSDLESWLMEWKRENRAKEVQGEVVYEFNNGWSVQKLTTQDQLQYEGDEMNHCVGGYDDDRVRSGESVIFSLRDPNNKPHATIEIEGAALYKETTSRDEMGNVYIPHFENEYDRFYYERLLNEGRTDLVKQFYPPKPHRRFVVSPEKAPMSANMYNRDGLLWDRTFEVVQIVGNSNTEPKPEYRGMIREFLEHLSRSRNIKFIVNTVDVDATPNVDPLDLHELATIDWLREWYESTYLPNLDLYHGKAVDEYGITRRPEHFRMYPTDIVGVINQVITGYVSWTEAAEILYRALQFSIPFYRGRALDTLEDIRNNITKSRWNIRSSIVGEDQILEWQEYLDELNQFDSSAYLRTLENIFSFLQYLIELLKSGDLPPGRLPSLEKLQGSRDWVSSDG